jgi:hypothetical protein
MLDLRVCLRWDAARRELRAIGKLLCTSVNERFTNVKSK